VLPGKFSEGDRLAYAEVSPGRPDIDDHWSAAQLSQRYRFARHRLSVDADALCGLLRRRNLDDRTPRNIRALGHRERDQTQGEHEQRCGPHLRSDA
jgi:hypothetical protein